MATTLLVAVSITASFRSCVEGGDVVKSRAADREVDDFMTVQRSRPGTRPRCRVNYCPKATNLDLLDGRLATAATRAIYRRDR